MATLTGNIYNKNGITVTPSKTIESKTCKLVYNGLLAQSGAEEIFAHIGYGPQWEQISQQKMTKTKNGFETTITITDPILLNVCFKDSANNWDNNSGTNYSFNISQ